MRMLRAVEVSKCAQGRGSSLKVASFVREESDRLCVEEVLRDSIEDCVEGSDANEGVALSNDVVILFCSHSLL